jgi:hypothetical protein
MSQVRQGQDRVRTGLDRRWKVDFSECVGGVRWCAASLWGCDVLCCAVTAWHVLTQACGADSAQLFALQHVERLNDQRLTTGLPACHRLLRPALELHRVQTVTEAGSDRQTVRVCQGGSAWCAGPQHVVASYAMVHCLSGIDPCARHVPCAHM